MREQNPKAEVDDGIGTGAGTGTRSGLKRDNESDSRLEGATSRASKRSRAVDTPEADVAITLERYTVGWVCALPLEMAAAKGMLDEVHPNLTQQDPADHNSYILGEAWGHNVVVACLPAGIYGTTPAATVAKDMLRTFKSIRFGLMVGIGGGAPSKRQDIRLGDVVVSQPMGTNGGVIQYDRGKALPQGQFQRTGSLNTPPQVLLAALSRLQADHLTGDSRIPEFLAELVAKSPKKMKKKFSHQGASNDCLYSAEYHHVDPDSTCAQCDPEQTNQREARDDSDPVIHYGTIASGNQVIKDGQTRDKLSKEFGVLCFETEAAGLQDFPCLVIRGICDYADSHKNKMWQEYAAATAAAFAKELLSIIPPRRVLQEKPITQLVSIANEHLQVSTQHLSLSSELLFEQKRTNQILEERPIDLHTVHEARYDSADVRDSPRCESGTRIRIQQTISQWADKYPGEPFFWLVGPAGTGKSTTIRTIADSFANNKRLAAGYFFKRGEKGRNDTSRLFSTLAMQLADSIPSFEACLRTSLGSLDKDAIEKKGLEFQFEKLLLLPLGCLPPVTATHPPKVIILDALDECERPEHLPRVLTLLSNLCNAYTTHLRVLFTSRSAPNIIEAFKPHVKEESVRSLELHREFSEDTKSDIRTFLKIRFADIRAKRRVEQDPWPTVEDLHHLVQLAINPEPLFIYAATLVRFVYDEYRPRNPKHQLKLWLKQCKFNKSQLHQAYDPILNQIFLGNDEEESGQKLKFLGALVLLATPLSPTSLTILLDMDMDDINWWLPELHAVLDISPEPHEPIRLLHRSFSDFLLDEESSDSNEYRVDASKTHMMLVEKCIQCMNKGLKQDICDVQKPGTFRSAIDKEKIDHCVPPHLRYACLYWFHHLQCSGRSLDSFVYTFLYDHFLHWLEVLSLVGQLSEGATVLSGLLEMNQHFPCAPSDFIQFVQDAKRIISRFGRVIERAPLQTYSSLLFLSPTKGKVRQRFWDERMPRLGCIQGVMSNWDARLQALGRHALRVTTIAFSLDGKLLATASEDRTVRLWDPITGKRLQTLWGHTGRVTAATFSPNSCLMASTDLCLGPFNEMDQTIRIWNVATGTCNHVLQGLVGIIVTLVFSPDSSLLMSASEIQVTRLWDANTGLYQESIDRPDIPEGSDHLDPHMPSGCSTPDFVLCVTAIAFSPCAQIQALAFSDGGICFLSLAARSHHYTLKNHTDPICTVAFSSDSQTLASGSADGTVRLWDVATGAQKYIIEIHDNVQVVTLSADGRLLATATANKIQLWDVASGACQNTLADRCVRAIAFSPDSQLLASGSFFGKVYIWDATLRTTQETFDGHGGFTTDLALSPDGHLLASASGETVQLWDTETCVRQRIFKDHTAVFEKVVFSPDNNLLASASRAKPPDNEWFPSAPTDEKIRIWDVKNGNLQETISGYWGSISGVAYSPDGQLVASISSYSPQIELWDPSTGTHQRTLEDCSRADENLTFSPDGRNIAAVLQDHAFQVHDVHDLVIWETSTGTHQQTLRGFGRRIDSFIFSHNSQLVAIVLHPDNISLWNWTTATHLHTFTHEEEAVGMVAFSPNTRLLASALNHEAVWLWDVVTGVHHHTLEDHEGIASAIAFSQDGQVVAVASDDTSVRLWHTAAEKHPHAILIHDSIVTTVQFSPSGQKIATVSRNKSIRVWDIASGAQQQVALHGGGGVMDVTFLPDELVVSISNFESTRFWNLWKGMALETRRYCTRDVTQGQSVSRRIGINIREAWITDGLEKLVWLPWGYRSKAWSQVGSAVVFSDQTGRIIRFQVS
ncbi:hypothetical protein NM208_g6003 [Fusarium decemcellulare]|uniref:Uncharacterized protein n=1 Tax=Fusarium decemcellulare TaxID=57161 RepID=A0ACC1SES6_9HYPO|nr:hypothetical protein NM208_g6003 [Fusarium decemcellulare]